MPDALLCLGVSRQHGARELDAPAHHFLEVLAREVGCVPHLHISESYAALRDEVLAGRVHVAWMPPLPMADAVQSGAVLAGLCQRGGQLMYRSALVVRASSSITTVADLIDRRAAWTNESSAGGYVVPRLALGEAGFDLTALRSESFFGSNLEAATAVAEGAADLAACYVGEAAAQDPLLAALQLQRALGERLAAMLRVLMFTQPIAPDGFVLASQLPTKLRGQLRTTLLELHRVEGGGEALRALLQAERVATATPEALRRLLSLVTRAPDASLRRD